MSKTVTTLAQRFTNSVISTLKRLAKHRTKQLVTALMLIVLPVALSGCSTDEWDWKQKLTIEVITPNGMVASSSVVAVHMANTTGELVPIAARGVSASVMGEAVVMEVAPGKYLFALLGGAGGLAQRVFDNTGQAGVEVWGPLIAQTRASKKLTRKQFPTLVTFGDINDPKSVKKVDPNNLAASFGKGFSLKSITAEILDPSTPITKGKVEKVLGWFNDKKTLKALWPKLSGKQHDLLSSGEWKSGIQK